jgi:transglycosylase-like protein with SLT domain
MTKMINLRQIIQDAIDTGELLSAPQVAEISKVSETFEIQTVLDPPVAPEKTIPEVIGAAAAEFDQDPVLLTRVAFCESTLRPAVIGDGGLAVGLFQFHPDTWREESRFLGYTEDLRAYPVAASRVAAFMFSRGLQHRWTCYGTVLAKE